MLDSVEGGCMRYVACEVTVERELTIYPTHFKILMYVSRAAGVQP